MRRLTIETPERAASLLCALLVAWTLLGRPDLRVRVLLVTRRALRAAAAAASAAAERTEDVMLRVATRD